MLNLDVGLEKKQTKKPKKRSSCPLLPHGSEGHCWGAVEKKKRRWFRRHRASFHQLWWRSGIRVRSSHLCGAFGTGSIDLKARI